MSRSLGGVCVMSRSPMKILPLLTSSSPASIRRVVDLPHPEGPTRTMNSPSSISNEIPGTAGLSAPGYHRCALSNVTVAMVRFPSPSEWSALDPAGEALDEPLLGEDVEREDGHHRDEHDGEDEVPLGHQRADVVVHDDGKGLAAGAVEEDQRREEVVPHDEAGQDGDRARRR